jgi:hypothetical protein
MPPASNLLRLVAFAVPAGLTLAGVQPVMGAATGSVAPGWAAQLTGPAIVAAGLLFLAARRFGPGRRGAATVVHRVAVVARRVPAGGGGSDVHLWRPGRFPDHRSDDVGARRGGHGGVGRRDRPGRTRLALKSPTPLAAKWR